MENRDYDLPPPPYQTRVLAFGVDMLTIVGLQLTLGALSLLIYRLSCHYLAVSSSESMTELLSEFSGGFLFVSYFTFSTGLFGNTLGKHLLNLQVIDEIQGQPIKMKKAYWRSLAYLMSSWTYMIGFIIPWFRTDRKALHDLLCGTRVVQRVPSAASTEQQLELPFLATVLQIRTPTTQEVRGLARTGTDP